MPVAEYSRLGAMVTVEIRSGTGAAWAERWASDLGRLVSDYARRHGWAIEERAGERTRAGVRRVVFEVRGASAHARLRWWHGVHRVQRPEGEDRRMHTSTAIVDVTPSADEPSPRLWADRAASAEKIRTCNVPEDRITDHRLGMRLYGLSRLVEEHLDRLADALDEHDGGPGEASPRA